MLVLGNITVCKLTIVEMSDFQPYLNLPIQYVTITQFQSAPDYVTSTGWPPPKKEVTAIIEKHLPYIYYLQFTVKNNIINNIEISYTVQHNSYCTTKCSICLAPPISPISC